MNLNIKDKILGFFKDKEVNSYQTADFFRKNDNSSNLNSYLETNQKAKYVWFGNNNQYPNYLNDLYNSSGLHSAIVDFKKNLISGAGFTIEGQDFLEAMKKVELQQFLSFIDGTNSLEYLLGELTLDYVLHGTIYLKIYWNSDKSRILKVKRVEPSKIRVGASKVDPDVIDRYYYNFDWTLLGNYNTIEYPAFSTIKKEPVKGTKQAAPCVEIFRYIVPNSAMLFNTLPSYASATNWIQLDGEISNYHKSNIENSINPSMTIKFYKRPANEEEKRAILSNIKKSYSGSSNTGKAMVFFSDDKESSPDVEPIQISNIDEQFNVTSDAIQRNICYAHKINPLVVGLKTPGSLGNSTELEISFEIFQKSVIEPAQRTIENIINKLLKINSLNVKFTLNEVELFTPTVKNN